MLLGNSFEINPCKSLHQSYRLRQGIRYTTANAVSQPGIL
jgi:hypothetical protein